MRLLAIMAVLMAALAVQTAAAQSLPASLRSAGITEAQWSQAQGLIRAQATTLNLREEAVRTLAIEIFEGQPDLSYDACLDLIREGAQRLPQLVATARALDPGGDGALADLQRRAVAAAEEGRLREALALQDDYRAAFQRAWERAAERPLLQLAAAHAAAGDTSYALGDYVGAAERYAQAAAAAPEPTRERWQYTGLRGQALFERSRLFSEPEPLRQAISAYEAALALRPRISAPLDWAGVQIALGNAQVLRGERGVPGALEQAVVAFEAALTVKTREADVAGWADAQMGLGTALLRQGQLGQPGALERAVAAYEAALTVWTREADPADWAQAQTNLGNALSVLGGRGAPGALERAVLAYEAALTVMTREADPGGWATTQNNLGGSLLGQAQRGVPGALERAVAAHEAALTVQSRDANPAGWAQTQVNLAAALSFQGRRGTPGALERAVVLYEAALTVLTRDSNPAGWASTQTNLGVTLAIQGSLGAPGALDRAVAALEAALTVRSRDADTAGWADTTYALALVYRVMGRLSEARRTAQGALVAYEQVGNAYRANLARAFIAELPAE
jgi:tetratricopeptide (TPR) repeat protein